MWSIERDIRELGDLAATHELKRRGHTQAGLRGGVRTGLIVRIRKGWYALPDLDDVLARAARVGGRLTCVSAAAYLGLWEGIAAQTLHVAVLDRACQLRDTDDYTERIDPDDPAIVVHWSDDYIGGDRLVVDAATMLEHIVQCCDPEFSFVVAEAVLRDRHLTTGEYQRLLERLPRRMRGELAHATSKSGSGSESTFSFRMRKLGVHFRQQVLVGVDRVDFLIGDRLIVEIDSVAHHTLLENCRRDARLSALGFRVIRFMFSQIVHEWESVRRSLLAALSRGDHRAF